MLNGFISTNVESYDMPPFLDWITDDEIKESIEMFESPHILHPYGATLVVPGLLNLLIYSDLRQYFFIAQK